MEDVYIIFARLSIYGTRLFGEALRKMARLVLGQTGKDPGPVSDQENLAIEILEGVTLFDEMC